MTNTALLIKIKHYSRISGVSNIKVQWPLSEHSAILENEKTMGFRNYLLYYWTLFNI